MRIFAIRMLAVGTLMLGCGGPEMKGGGGSGGSDETGGDGGTNGSTGLGGSGGSSSGGKGGSSSGGSGGSTEKLDAAPATGGAGGSDEKPDAGTSSGSEAGVSGGDGGSSVPAGLHKIFDGTTTNGWDMYPAGNCVVKDGALTASGIGRGWCATKEDYTHYRLLFSLHPGGTGGHAPTVLIFNTRAPDGQKGLDALGGIQFQPPNGGHWDYRPGKNTAGAGFTKIGGPGPAVNGWYQCEMIVNASTGEAKMACGGKDVLHYKDPTAGKKGPWAIQTHNKGITDAYKDIQVEEGLTSDAYITVK
jgi:3-keto-disaccharide hydrolase